MNGMGSFLLNCFWMGKRIIFGVVLKVVIFNNFNV